jgi:hypothetical protein
MRSRIVAVLVSGTVLRVCAGLQTIAAAHAELCSTTAVMPIAIASVCDKKAVGLPG